MVFAGFMSQNNLIGGGGSPPIDNYTFNNPSYTPGDYLDLTTFGLSRDDPTGLSVRDSGAGVYIVDDPGAARRISLLNMPTPYDITSVTTQLASGTNLQGGNPRGMRVDPNGIDFFYIHNAAGNNDILYYQAFNVANDPSGGNTGVLDSVNIGNIYGGHGSAFTYTGNDFYQVNNGTQINRYDNPGYSAVPKSFVGFTGVSNTTGVFPAGADIGGMDMKDDGSKFYFIDSGNEAIYECDAATNFDTSTLSIVNTISLAPITGILGADHPGGTPNWSGLGIVRDTGTDIYFSDFTNTRIYRINLA